MAQVKRTRPRRAAGALALAALALALPSAIEAQTGSIRGQVVDAITLRAIGGAQVQIVDTRRGGLTNTSGQFLLLNVPVGDHEVRVQFIGFATVTQNVTVASGETAVLDFELAQRRRCSWTRSWSREPRRRHRRDRSATRSRRSTLRTSWKSPRSAPCRNC